jgi:hypothetical protein
MSKNETATTRRPDDNATLSFLTRWDGDFTYSLDLARYLAVHGGEKMIQLTATGIDSSRGAIRALEV